MSMKLYNAQLNNLAKHVCQFEYMYGLDYYIHAMFGCKGPVILKIFRRYRRIFNAWPFI